MKIVEVTADDSSVETLRALTKKAKTVDFRVLELDESQQRRMRMLVRDDQLQIMLDRLQTLLGAQPAARIVVQPVEICLPQPDEAERASEDASTAPREAIFEEMERNSRLGSNYLLLVALSTVVAAIGLIEDNVAVLVGAMVIAPLLGPNLALSFGTALGDRHLVVRSLLTLGAGAALAIGLSVLIGYFWPETISSHELQSRTAANLASVALALASGAAAALSITAGVSSVLVGVMVAVALLPPAAAIGISLGQGNFDGAQGAALLLGVNIVALNLAAKVVLLVRGFHPRRFYEKARARRATVRVILGWVLTLLILVALVPGVLR